MVAPMRRRFALPYLCKAYRVSERRACRVLVVNRSTVHCQSVKTDVPALRARINEIAATRVRYGYPRIHVLLRREGWVVNRKRVYRIYREEGLAMRLKTPKRRKSAVVRTERSIASAVNQTWSMDFMADNLADGRKIRLLTIVDTFSRECLALDVASGFKGGNVVQALTRVTTALSSSQKRSINGRLGTKCSSTSHAPESRQTMRLSNRSMSAFVKNSSTRAGVPNITIIDRIDHSETAPQRSLPERTRTLHHKLAFSSSKGNELLPKK